LPLAGFVLGSLSSGALSPKPVEYISVLEEDSNKKLKKGQLVIENRHKGLCGLHQRVEVTKWAVGSLWAVLLG
jgi:hypothetical protein